MPSGRQPRPRRCCPQGKGCSLRRRSGPVDRKLLRARPCGEAGLALLAAGRPAWQRKPCREASAVRRPSLRRQRTAYDRGQFARAVCFACDACSAAAGGRPGAQGVGQRQQVSHRLRQDRGRCPPVAHLFRILQRHRREEGAPVVTHHFCAQFGLIGFERLREQAATVERVFAQHAVAPAVDGRHGRLVHPLGREAQGAGAGKPLGLRIVGTQVVQQVFAMRHRAHRGRVREERHPPPRPAVPGCGRAVPWWRPR